MTRWTNGSTRPSKRCSAGNPSNGSFGLWYPDSGDLWLDAYVSDFLSRARAEGYVVPQLAFRLSMDNLRNKVNYTPDDFDEGRQRTRPMPSWCWRARARRAMADLRYYADEKGRGLHHPARGGATGRGAGDVWRFRPRADRLFARAGRLISAQAGAENQVWRVDYGTRPARCRRGPDPRRRGRQQCH